MSTTITPTVGRIVWYRGADGRTRAAIVAAVHGIFCLNLFVFGLDASDVEQGYKTSVTHADPEVEPSCLSSWHWMPYQVGQAKKQESEVAAGSAPKTPTSDQAIEAEIVAKGKTAPRITPAALQAVITSEFYFTAADGVAGDSGHRPNSARAGQALSLLTFCVLVLRNGFTVTGESACASPENFDAEIGRQIARQNAEQKIWALEGYLLKQRLFEVGNTPPAPHSDLPPHQQRVIDEKSELDDKLTKLTGFLNTPLFASLGQDERSRLGTQHEAMSIYADVLRDRIAAFPA